MGKRIEIRGLERYGQAEPTWNVDVEPGKSIRIHGVYQPNTQVPSAYDKTFAIGDECVIGSYNLVYVGRVVSIGPKTVTVREDDRFSPTTKRFTFHEFTWRNHGFDRAAIAKHNAVESQCI